MKNHLRTLRAEREWSQADLASRLDVSRQTVNALETGKYDPSLPLAFKIARLFDRHIEDIFVPNERGEGEPRGVTARSGVTGRGTLRRRSGTSSA
ncbi:MAG: helix-turn-helix transcriptional regulator [Terriglobales bacterium]